MSGDLRFSLLLQGDATSAKAAAAEAASAIDGTRQSLIRVKDSASAARTEMQRAVDSWAGVNTVALSAAASAQAFTDALSSERAQFEALRASIDPVYAATQRYAAVVNEISIQRKLGTATDEEANAALAAAAVAFSGLVPQAAAARQALEGTSRALSLNRIQMLEATHVSREMITMLATGIPVEQAFGMEFGRIMTFFQAGEAGMLGTLRAIGAGLVSFLVNPLTITAAALTATGVAVAYFTGAFGTGMPSVKEYEAAVKAAASAQTAFTAANRDSLTPMEQLRKEFGANSEEARKLYDLLRSLAILKFDAAFGEATKGMESQFAGMERMLSRIDTLQANIAAGKTSSGPLLFGQSNVEGLTEKLNAQFGVTVDQARNIVEAFRQVKAAADDLGRAQALDHLSQVLMASVDASGQLPPKIRDLATEITHAAIEGLGLSHALQTSADVERDMANRDIGGPIRAAVQDAEDLAAALAKAQASVTSSELALTEAKLRAQYGKDSVGLAGALSGARFDASIAATGAIPVTHEDRDQLSADRALTVQNAQQAAQYDLTARAEAKAAGSVRHLTDVQRAENQVMKDLFGSTQDYNTMVTALDQMLAQGKITQSQYNYELRKTKDAFSGATDGSREFLQQAKSDFVSLLTLTEDWKTALSNLLVKFAQIEASNAFDSLFGNGKGTSGLLGDLAGGLSSLLSGGDLFANIGGNATGGLMSGPGTGTSDSILARLSNGEFVVNAAATSRHLPLLQAINAGALPAFASGGYVGGSADDGSSAASSSGGARSIEVHVHGARGNAEIETMVAKGIRLGLDHYDRNMLPKSVARIRVDGRRIG